MFFSEHSKTFSFLNIRNVWRCFLRRKLEVNLFRNFTWIFIYNLLINYAEWILNEEIFSTNNPIINSLSEPEQNFPFPIERNIFFIFEISPIRALTILNEFRADCSHAIFLMSCRLGCLCSRFLHDWSLCAFVVFR